MDKPRLVVVSGWELDYFFKHAGDLDVPTIHAFNDGPPYLCDVEQLRAWRSAPTSEGPQS